VAINEYDQLLAEVSNAGALPVDAPPAGLSPADQAMAAVREDDKTALQQSMFVAAKANPDRQAEVVRIARKRNLPSVFVDQNLEAFKEDDAKQVNNYDTMIRDTPGLSNWLTNPDNAALAKDDLDSLKKLEQTVNDRSIYGKLYDSLRSGMATADANLAKVPGLAYDAFAIPGNLAIKAGLIDSPQVSSRTLGESLGISNKVAEYYDTSAKAFAPEEMNQSVSDHIAKGDYSSAGKTLALQFVANSPQQAVNLLTAMSGAPAAGLALAGATTAAQANSENLAAGAEPLQAVGNALAKGTIEAGFESLGTFGILHKWEGAIAKQYGKSTSREVMKDFAKTMAYSFAGEANEEFMTSVAQDFTDYITGVNPDALKGIGQRALDAGIVGGFSGGLMTGPAAIGSGVARSKQIREAAMNRDFYNSFGSSAEATKLRQRLPEAQRDLVNMLTQGTPLENIYIPVEAMEGYFQSKNLNPVGVAAELGISQAFDEARETGGNVKIPLGVWTEKVVGTPHYGALQNDVKFSPDGHTINELQAEDTRTREDLAQADEAARALEGVGVEAAPDTAPQVREEIANLLRNTGKFDEKQIDQVASLYEERYRSRADRRGLGESALDLFKSQGLDVQANEFSEPQGAVAAQTQDGQSFEQGSRGDWQTEGYRFEETKSVPNMVGRKGDKILDGITHTIKAIAPDGTEAGSFEFYENKLGGATGLIGINGAYVKEPHKRKGLASAAYQMIEQQTGGVLDPQEQVKDAQTEDAKGLWAQADRPFGKQRIDRSPEARKARAEEMGFDTSKVYYHGTEKNFDSFKAGGGGHVGPGIYITENQAVAENFGSRVIEMYAKVNKPADLRTYAGTQQVATAIGVNNLKLEDGARYSSHYNELLQAFKATVRAEDPANADGIVGTDWDKLLQERLKDAGYDAIDYEWNDLPARSVFDPNQLRSVDAVFDPELSESANIYNQSGATPRGRIQFGRQSALIELFDGNDASTILHESGHLWLEELITDATTEGANPNLARDLDTILEWMGVEARSSDGRAAIKAAVQTDQHEQWARGFEAYLMEGKAPSQALRKAFARFKLWLTRIYRNIRQLDVELTPDVRRVFDRMLVAEQELQVAEAEMGFDPLFADPKAMGMNDTQAARYEKAREDAHQAALDTLTNRLMEDLRRERDAWWKEEKARTRTEVEAEIATDQRYQTLAILQKGETELGLEVKLDRASIVQRFGKEFAKSLPRGILTNEGGQHFDVVAEMLGFESGDAMLTTLANLQKPNEYIAAETDRRMQQDYPELASDEHLLDTAKSLALSEDRAKVLRMELEHLASNNLPVLKDAIRRVTKRVPTEAAVRKQAETLINGKAVGELSPRAYMAAGVKAAKEAGIALARGDFDAAFEAKRKELLNLELHRAATAAQENVDKAMEKFKDLRRRDEDLAKTRDTDIINAARAVLARFGLGPKTDKTADEYLSPIKTYDPESYGNLVEIVNGAAQNAMPYKQMSYEDFLAVSDLYDAMWEMSRSLRTMEVDGQRVDREAAIDQLSVRLEELTKDGPLPGTEQAITDSERRTMSIRSLINMTTRVESWARAMDKNDINGAFTKYIVRPILTATTNYRTAKDVKLEELKKLVQGLTIADPEALIPAANLNYNFTKPSLLMALLHTGNDSNKKKLLLGRGWGSLNADGTLDSSRWDAFVAKAIQEGTITKSDMDFVQGVWDLNESLKADAQKAHKKMYGFYFNEVTANKVVTPFGEYRGGYMPAISDADLSVDASIRAGQSLEDAPNQMFPTTGRGFTKSRMEQYTTPLSLDFGKIQGHIDKVLKFTYIEPSVKEVARLVNNRGLRGTLNAYDNGLANDVLIPYLKRAAVQSANVAGQSKMVDKAASWLRRSTSLQVMTVNVTNAIQNFTGAFPVMTQVGAASLAGSMKRYLSDRKAYTQWINETSPYMKQRMDSTSRDSMKAVDEVILAPDKFQTVRETAIHYGYALDRMTNGMMEYAAWGAAYNDALSKGLKHEDAVNKADATVRQALMGGNPEDLASFEAATPFAKLFTMFSSFFNTQANLLRTEISIAREEGLTSKAGGERAVKAYTLVVALPAILSAVIGRALAGEGLDADDDGEYWDDVLDIFFGSQVKYLAAFVPGNAAISFLGGKAKQGVAAALKGQGYDRLAEQMASKGLADKLNPSAALSSIERAGSALVSVPSAVFGNGDVGKAIREGALALGFATGLPVVAAAKPAAYVADVKSGKAKPTGTVDFTRGLVTGRAGNTK
jgi:hypothetical protein